jgi:hypothetical protein
MKEDIIENYILKDSSCVRWPGKFESVREAHLAKVMQAKQKLDKNGYCVSCQKEIQLDARPNAYYIQCGSCYYIEPKANTNLDVAMPIMVKFCHFCGDVHAPQSHNPFHDHCRSEVNGLWQLSRYH